MPIAYVKMFTFELCRRFPDAFFVFGDNHQGWGKKGQAIIRDEPNAIGFRTKVHPGYGALDYYTDQGERGSHCRRAIEQDLGKLRVKLEAGKTVVLPLDGLGTGLARLDAKAPTLYARMCDGIEELVAFHGVVDLETDRIVKLPTRTAAAATSPTPAASAAPPGP